MTIEAAQVERLHRQRSTPGARKEAAFARLYLQDTFGLGEDDLGRAIDAEGNHHGIDAFHLDTNRRNLYLFQFQWTEDCNAFKDGMRNLSERGIEWLFEGRSSETRPNIFLQRLKSFVNENRSIIDQVLVHFVFTGDPSDADHSAILTSLREELEGKKYIIDDFFGHRSVGLAFEFRSTESDQVSFVHQVKTHRYRFDFARSIADETPHGEALQMGFVKLIDLLKMYDEMGPRFFERNIRYGISSAKPTNRALYKALQDIVIDEKTDPETFLFNHNGVTLAAEQLEVKKGAAYITEPRLLNGAQTVTTLASFVHSYEGDPAFERNRDVLERIKVPGKVVCQAAQDFIANVTICNNRQNPVEPWNLRANDDIQLEYQEKFRRDLGVYYERQEGAFGSLTDEDRDDLGVGDHRAVQIKRLAQTLLAVQGEIDKMSRMRHVFENENIYRQTFRESYLKASAERIILAYKVQFRINRVIRDVMEQWPTKYHYLGRARNLMWALMIQGLFNDKNVEAWAETHGSNLTVTHEFTDILLALAAKKVRFLISDVAGSERYKELVDQGNFHVLRTKATYQRCMEAAAERFDWKKKSF